METNTLSVCMIVKNEEQYLDSCLSAISNKVDEIILVDTGSTDNTLEIARKHAAKIFEIEWIDDFSHARNFSIQQATKDWILVIDADEIIPDHELSKIYQLIQTPNVFAYQIMIRNILPKDEIISYTEQPALRLFKNQSGFEYRGKVHESVQASILDAGYKVTRIDIYMEHYGYAHLLVQGSISRGQRNLSLLLSALQSNKNDPYILYQLGITYKHLENFVLAEKYLKDALSFNKKELSVEILSDIFLKLAQISLLTNQSKKVIKYARKSIQNNPNNMIAVYLLSVQLVEAKQFKAAVPQLQFLLNTKGIDPEDKDDIKVLLHYSLSKI